MKQAILALLCLSAANTWAASPIVVDANNFPVGYFMGYLATGGNGWLSSNQAVAQLVSPTGYVFTVDMVAGKVAGHTSDTFYYSQANCVGSFTWATKVGDPHRGFAAPSDLYGGSLFYVPKDAGMVTLSAASWIVGGSGECVNNPSPPPKTIQAYLALDNDYAITGLFTGQLFQNPLSITVQQDCVFTSGFCSDNVSSPLIR